MRKITFLLLFACIYQAIHASNSLPTESHDSLMKEPMIPLVGTGKFVTVTEFLNLTPQAYRDLTGKKLSFGEKIDLRISKHFLKRMIRKHGTADIATMQKRGFFSGWQWHWGGFALGLFFSFLGVLVTLFFNDDYKWDRFWTAFHTALWLGVIVAIIVAVSVGSGY